MKKTLLAITTGLLSLALLAGCSAQKAGFDDGKAINVVSREDGSGTRGAFIELFGVEQKGEDGT